jgi:hypothetical protein
MSSSQYPAEKTGEEHPPPQPPRPKAAGDAQYNQHQYPQIPVSQSGAEHQYPQVPIPGPPGYPSTLPPQYNTHGTEPQYEYPPPPAGGPPNQQYAQQLQSAMGGQPNQQYVQQQQSAMGAQPNQQYSQQQQPTTWTPQYDGPPAMTPASGLATDTTHHGKLSTWDKTRNTSKAGFDKLWNGFEKLGVPVNKLTNKIGSEAFWPQSLDKESDKCARILKSFCSKSNS